MDDPLGGSEKFEFRFTGFLMPFMQACANTDIKASKIFEANLYRKPPKSKENI